MKIYGKGKKPGLSINYAWEQVLAKRRVEASKVQNQDSQNRKYVADKVHEYMEAGKSLDEAVDLIMQDDIIKEFDYWAKNGLDVRQCVKNLVKSYPNRKQTKGQER